MTSFSLCAPAKLNLFLRLTGKRRDGYNNIITVFHRISLCDVLTFSPSRSGIIITCDHLAVPCNHTNLIHKAYELLRKRCGFRKGVRVHLKKNIPLEAGLGGASSDAATALRGFNRLFKLGLSQWDLYELGSLLGADVPFFLTSYQTALGIERGDKVIRLGTKKTKLYFVLFVFKKGLKTQKVYQKFTYKGGQISLTNIISKVIMLPLSLNRKDVNAIERISYNDLLRPAGIIKPHIVRLIKQLKHKGFSASQMTGSGSTVYTIINNRKEARELARQFADEEEFSTMIVQSY
ncbi:MAG: 4-(cytidine 5'-diphospho)-2-C-methyl-D-erythritol kinase [Candidatus Omnitrophica bacterium]|nr:4-(cytidine 5'-diphospho)-2-C-methyl-D-erythritol kinase [Candidatus Omnitrophota bacterium]